MQIDVRCRVRSPSQKDFLRFIGDDCIHRKNVLRATIFPGEIWSIL
jgi:hypothetical protein